MRGNQSLNENEERVYYYRPDGSKASVCGLLDLSDPDFILVQRRAGLVRIPRARLDFIGPATPPDGARA